MANPQPEPFLKFSLELFDAVVRSPMPATHKEVVLALVRLTYGNYGKKEAPVSLAKFAQLTGRHKVNVKRALTDLIAEGVVRQVKPPSFAASAVYRINKDYEAWGKWSVELPGGSAEATGSTEATGSRDTETTGSTEATQQGVQRQPVVDVDSRSTASTTGGGSAEATPPDPAVVEATEELRRVEGYPFDESQDTQLLGELKEEYPAVDLKAEIRSWKLWLRDNPTKKKRNYRLALRNWIRKADEFRKKGGGDGDRAHPGDRKAAVGGRSRDGEW